MPSTPDASPAGTRPLVVWPALAWGLKAAAVTWTLWFLTHIPWARVPNEVSLGIILLGWLAVMVLAGRSVGPARAWKVGVIAGVFSGLLGLLVLGSQITSHPGPDQMARSEIKPNGALIAAGYLALSAVIGAVGGLLGGRLRAPKQEPDWMFRLVLGVIFVAAPLISVGGLVTSTGSGMAVPDWPGTYGANMFLYPLGNAPVGVFLEHSHRLFGALVGCAAITLALGSFFLDKRAGVRGVAVGLLLFIIFQGILGGTRVIRNAEWLAFFHGISAHAIIATLAGLAVFVSPAVKELAGARPPVLPGKVRIWATAAMHTLALQIVFGAMYRHTGSNHALMSHIVFSVLATIAAIMGATKLRSGSAISTPTRPEGRLAGAAGSIGAWVLGLIALQFLMGWVTLFATGVGNANAEPESPGVSVLQTTHQIGGALLLALATTGAMITKIIAPRRAASRPTSTPAAA